MDLFSRPDLVRDLDAPAHVNTVTVAKPKPNLKPTTSSEDYGNPEKWNMVAESAFICSVNYRHARSDAPGKAGQTPRCPTCGATTRWHTWARKVLCP